MAYEVSPGWQFIGIRPLTDLPKHIQTVFSLAKMGRQLVSPTSGIPFFCSVYEGKVEGKPAFEFRLHSVSDENSSLKHSLLISIWVEVGTLAILKKKIYD